MPRVRGTDPKTGGPRYARCKGCGEPIGADDSPKPRWRAAPRLDGPRQNNRDGSANLDGKACNDTADGKHKPAPGSLW